jgi:cobalt/nickel transport system permease protein
MLTNTAGIAVFFAACYGARKELTRKKLPSLLAMTTFVFLAQMLNCATGFGFSGHLVGTALLAVLFGPCLAIVAMGAVLGAQVMLLGDGAWSTLGANFINMGLVPAVFGYVSYQIFSRRAHAAGAVRSLTAVGAASFISIVAGAGSLGIMLPGVFSPIIAVHLVIGAFEALLTVAVLALCDFGRKEESLPEYWLTMRPVQVLALLCLVAVVLLPLSSNQDDGLEHVLATSSVELN